MQIIELNYSFTYMKVVIVKLGFASIESFRHRCRYNDIIFSSLRKESISKVLKLFLGIIDDTHVDRHGW